MVELNLNFNSKKLISSFRGFYRGDKRQDQFLRVFKRVKGTCCNKVKIYFHKLKIHNTYLYKGDYH